jgi:hypothetical protein
MSTPLPRGFEISIFLPEGTPESFRIIEKSNWIGKGIACTRSQYPEVRTRPEFQRPGVYVLYGPTEDQTRSKVYVGEGDNVRTRIDQHLKEKDFWQSLILFTSKDENLNKAHIRRIEGRLIARANSAKRAEVDNGTAPSEHPLSEQDAAFADVFSDEMLLIYPVLGVEAFEALPAETDNGDLYLNGPGAQARGAAVSDKFVVFKGAAARGDEVPSIPPTYATLRKTLVGEGVLVPEGDGLRLEEDYLFSSPSAAAAVFLGRSANGRDEWKTKGGVTLKQLEIAEADSPVSVEPEPALL